MILQKQTDLDKKSYYMFGKAIDIYTSTVVVGALGFDDGSKQGRWNSRFLLINATF